MSTTDYADPEVEVETCEAPKRVSNKLEVEVRIPLELLASFVGPVENLYKIDQIKVSYTKYRVNVWTKRKEENAVVPRFDIAKSFYLDYNKTTGVLEDRTDRRVISLDGGLEELAGCNSCAR